MKTVVAYVDELKEKLGSDYKIAKAMKVDSSVITNIRKRGAISEENALKIAELLEIEADEILIAAAIARSSGGVREAWERVYKKAGAAAAIFLLIAGGISPSECEANGGETLQFIHYAKLWRLASWRL